MEDYLVSPEVHLDSNGLLILETEIEFELENLSGGDECFLLSDDEIDEDELKAMCRMQQLLA
jgi:hypothetical protein